MCREWRNQAAVGCVGSSAFFFLILDERKITSKEIGLTIHAFPCFLFSSLTGEHICDADLFCATCYNSVLFSHFRHHSCMLCIIFVLFPSVCLLSAAQLPHISLNSLNDVISNILSLSIHVQYMCYFHFTTFNSIMSIVNSVTSIT